jgi:hypothetical protein
MTLELSPDPLKRYIQFRDDPWLYLKHCVWTRDQVDSVNPIKKYPAHWPYLRFIVYMWTKHKKLALPKSRRMTVSWTILGLISHDILFHKGRDWAVVSKKEEDSRELVERIEFIINHIPPDMISPDLLPKMKRGEMQSSPPAIEFEEIYSKVQGFPQGGNQLRQRGFSGIFEDECSFWEEAQQAYASAKPTIDGGGRMIMVSSRAVEDKGFFKKIVFDQLDAPDTHFPEIAPAPVKSPMDGVDVWENPRNGFTVIELHYKAHPERKSEEYRQMLKDTLPRKEYMMEYEKSWEAYSGRPVFEDFNEALHVTKIPPKVHPNLPLLVGWDSSGLTPAAIICQMQDDRLIVIREILGTELGVSVGARRFVPHVAAQIRLHYPQCGDIEKQTISFFDPAGFKKNEITEETYLAELMRGGFKQIRPGAMTIKKRVDGVTQWLLGTSKGGGRLQIYDRDCPTFIAGMRGGYRYSDSSYQIEPDKAQPLKDSHSHVHDAFQYLTTGLAGHLRENYNITIPTPSYSFQKEQARTTVRKNYGRDVR